LHGQQQKGNPLTALLVLSVLSVLPFRPHGAPVCVIWAIRAPRQAPHLLTTGFDATHHHLRVRDENQTLALISKMEHSLLKN
jgi:hypothetical protein